MDVSVGVGVGVNELVSVQIAEEKGNVSAFGESLPISIDRQRKSIVCECECECESVCVCVCLTACVAVSTLLLISSSPFASLLTPMSCIIRCRPSAARANNTLWTTFMIRPFLHTQFKLPTKTCAHIHTHIYTLHITHTHTKHTLVTVSLSKSPPSPLNGFDTYTDPQNEEEVGEGGGEGRE